MAYFARRIESCPHRRCGKSNGAIESPECRLLHQIADQSGTHHPNVGRVTESVCQSCCRWFLPTMRDWNPVVASLVLDRLVGNETLANVNQPGNTDSILHRAVAAIPILKELPNDEIPSEEALESSPSVQQLEAILPLPSLPANPLPSQNRDWMVGITTAPRRHPTLRHCLDGLRKAGWKQVHVFADGVIPDSVDDGLIMRDVTLVHRKSSVGGWSNFVLSAQELVHRNPDADSYLMLQDDALLTRVSSLRSYVDRLMDRIGSDAMASLYSCAADTQPHRGWYRAREPVQRGAQGFVFGRLAMHRFLADAITRPWEHERFHRGKGRMEQRGIDGNVGRWAAHSRTPLWLPTPSLIWHLGETSTLWPGAAMLGIRRAGVFLESCLRAPLDEANGMPMPAGK